ncbi:MAG TPA: hypothetical protein PKC73_10465 [Dermatophilaceae bacterium]|nr:hypothetical protein [Actinomycetales bacterium]HMT33562.1 hypothetical protein [Dermatophilaceae bacterium]HMT90048.1 hypothetical protein [Dermatophilaceae bacterium]
MIDLSIVTNSVGSGTTPGGGAASSPVAVLVASAVVGLSLAVPEVLAALDALTSAVLGAGVLAGDDVELAEAAGVAAEVLVGASEQAASAPTSTREPTVAVGRITSAPPATPRAGR